MIQTLVRRSLPLMGIRNVKLLLLMKARLELTTPHGDQKLPSHSERPKRPRSILTTPHGDQKPCIAAQPLSGYRVLTTPHGDQKPSDACSERRRPS